MANHDLGPNYVYLQPDTFHKGMNWDTVNDKLNEMYGWYTFMAQKEDELCEKYPALKSARENYLVVRALCTNEKEK